MPPYGQSNRALFHLSQRLLLLRIDKRRQRYLYAGTNIVIRHAADNAERERMLIRDELGVWKGTRAWMHATFVSLCSDIFVY